MHRCAHEHMDTMQTDASPCSCPHALLVSWSAWNPILELACPSDFLDKKRPGERGCLRCKTRHLGAQCGKQRCFQGQMLPSEMCVDPLADMETVNSFACDAVDPERPSLDIGFRAFFPGLGRKDPVG